MKVRMIEEVLKQKGFERGVIHVLQTQQEQINTVQRSVTELASLLDQIIQTLNNVVAGASGMRQDMLSRMKRAGLNMPEDDMDPNTHALGDD